MLYVLLRPRAGRRLINLPGWERQRVADEILLLSDEPRPRRAKRLHGETYELWVGDIRVLYRIFEDVGVIIQKISWGP